MKTKLLLLAVSVCLIVRSAFAQGDLNPPGAPGPTMKSLDQIEARTPISSLPYTINTGGSYYLTGNLSTAVSNGIVIAASGVTLDLNGFTIYSSVPFAQNGGTAILLKNNITDVTVQNGHIFSGVVNTGLGYFGSGFGSGILGGASDNITIRNLSVSGCLYYGILIGTSDSKIVESCTVRTVGLHGISASIIKTSLSIDCGATGILGYCVYDCQGQGTGGAGISAYFIVQNSEGYSTGSGDGVSASIVQNCFGQSGSGTGIYADTAQNCRGISSSGTGLFASGEAQNSYGLSNTGNGIVATTALNCFGRSDSSGYGIFASTAQNCYSSSGSGTGLSAFIANVCHGISDSGTAMSVTHNVNSF